MQLKHYQTGSDSFQDNMADPNAHRVSRVKHKKEAQRDLIHKTTECNNLYKNGLHRNLSSMKSNVTVYVRIGIGLNLLRTIKPMQQFLKEMFDEQIGTIVQYAHNSILFNK